MSVSKKRRRTITVDGRTFVWYIAEDDESDHLLLNIISNDKRIICSVPIDIPAAYVISKGNEFQGNNTSGTWERYSLPLVIPAMITPGFVSEVIHFIKNGDTAEQVSWDQDKYPDFNYYGTEKYYKRMRDLDRQIFSKIKFDEPDRIRELDNGYCVKYYYYADEENCLPGHAPVDGEICRLFKNDEMIFEWKNTDGNSRMAVIIDHVDGQQYFVFDEDLYGYSVLKLSDLTCIHYIPEESYGKYPDEFEETFIWCDCFYNPENNMLAVDGCYWACPNNIIVLDFADPMHIVGSKEWMDIYKKCSEEYPDIDDIEFVRWDGAKLVCKVDGAGPEGIWSITLNGKR